MHHDEINDAGTGNRRGVLGVVANHWRWILPLSVVGGAIGLWLAFSFFGVHTLFVDSEANEAGPVFSSGPDSVTLEAGEDELPEVEEPEVEEPEVVVTAAEGSFVGRSHPASGRAFVLANGSEQRFLRFEDFETDNGPDLNVYLTKADADAPEGDFGQPGEFVDLGDLKGNIGSQNYEIPPEVNIEEFDTVVIWCVRFGVAFGAADLVTN